MPQNPGRFLTTVMNRKLEKLHNEEESSTEGEEEPPQRLNAHLFGNRKSTATVSAKNLAFQSSNSKLDEKSTLKSSPEETHQTTNHNKEIYELTEDLLDSTRHAYNQVEIPRHSGIPENKHTNKCSCLETGIKECHCCRKQQQSSPPLQYELWTTRKTFAIVMILILLLVWIVVFSSLLTSQVI